MLTLSRNGILLHPVFANTANLASDHGTTWNRLLRAPSRCGTRQLILVLKEPLASAPADHKEALQKLRCETDLRRLRGRLRQEQTSFLGAGTRTQFPTAVTACHLLLRSPVEWTVSENENTGQALSKHK